MDLDERPTSPAEVQHAGLSGVASPTAVIDLGAFLANASEMRQRAGDLPIRLASKSIRVRGLIERLLYQDGFAGVLAYSAAEALWLVEHGVRDVVVAYPTVDRATLAAVSANETAAAEIAFMVDLPEHVRLVAEAVGEFPLRVAIDVDCSLRVGPVSIGAHRSSVRSVEDAERLAALVASTEGLRLSGLMFYDAQVAGVQDTSTAVRLMKRASLADLARRRRRVVAAVSRHGALDFVNAGGTGSLHLLRDDPVVTDLAAGSGLFTPTLFDGYDGARLHPAAFFVSPVVRKPADDVVVAFAGGYAASGPAGRSRVPSVAFPQGLRPFGQEGVGEVQTPLRGEAARSMELGDLIWFRHAKAGEMCERFDEVVLLEQGQVVGRLPTYRGEGKNFG
ncbi:alanine racemase [Luteipulveratus sp. YIM 133132]|uniref:alanine racemase n=1 Tax=Luteipulveratus flavus TaxID=3031728 RepID=UPI0023AFB56F|nr:alanine racemase [Luteipulveratus sp. YIM 133132]MDE9365118.1 alanine racemase [Luteipulveratus sp. YIM 133132]